MAQIGQRYILLADIDLGIESADALKISVVLPSALVGVAYTGALIASGGTPPYTYDDTPPGTVPPGLTIDPSTGAVTGTPSAVGYYEFTASVTDSAFSPATASIVVSIRVLSGIAFSGSFQPGEVGIAYSDGLSASGGTPPYTWSLPSGSLPGGLGPIDSSTGIVAGTPTTPGTFNFTVRATDSLGNPQDFPTSIAIAAALDITTTTFPDGFVGVFYNAGPTVIGGVAPISYSVSSGAIPAGTTFAPSTGFVTGQPTTVATYTFDITGVDVLGGTSTVSLSVDVTTGGGSGGGQASIQFESHGSNLGTAGTVDEFDVTAPLSGSRTGDKVTYVHDVSGVTAATYGDSTHVAQVAFNATGHATSASSVAIDITSSGGALIGQIDVYSTAGSTSWSKPSNAQVIEVICVGGGGSGGGGAADTGNNRSGGGGGGAGAKQVVSMPASAVGSSETVIVGAGGAQVSGGTAPANGATGNPGGASSFGAYVSAYGGGGGGPGANIASSGGAGGGFFAVGGVGVVGTSVAGDGGGQGSPLTTDPPTNVSLGGGAGGSTTINSTGFNGGKAIQGASGGGGGGAGAGTAGGAGGASYDEVGTSIAGGTTNGGNGATQTGINPAYRGIGGSGGGGAGTASGGGGGNGGAGQQPGGGGGGGGAVRNAATRTGGNGGKGGDGIVVVITWF